MKKRCHSPLPSAGAELAVAATGRSVPKWSSCFYCSCQCETGWVFERAWTGAGHLLLSWDNCACCLSENKGKYVGGEQESPVSGQLWEFEPRDGKLPARLPDHDISNTGHGLLRFSLERYPACHLYRTEQSHYRLSLFSTLAFSWWLCDLLRIFNPEDQIVQF